MCFNVGNIFDDAKGAPSFGKMWDSFGEVDPLLHGAIDDQSKLDDRVTGAVLGGLGLSGPAKYFQDSSEDPTKSAEHHALAGLAWLGGEAALGAAGETGAGGALGSGASLPADVSVGTTGAGGATASAGSGAAAGSGWVGAAETAAKYVAPAVISSLLQPKPPNPKAPTAMPDPLAQQQAQQQKLLRQLARRGRASTILTNPGSGSGSLGG